MNRPIAIEPIIKLSSLMVILPVRYMKYPIGVLLEMPGACLKTLAIGISQMAAASNSKKNLKK
jgi:hypothetical protein